MRKVFLVIYAMKGHTQNVPRYDTYYYYLHIKLITKEIVLKNQVSSIKSFLCYLQITVKVLNDICQQRKTFVCLPCQGHKVPRIVLRNQLKRYNKLY